MKDLLLADLLLVVHTGFVVFVILGLALVLGGKVAQWQWVRNPWFRALHLAAIGVVVLQAWLGMVCPLTRWEMLLRQKAGGATYAGSFIVHWLDRLLYYQAPSWVFTACYTVFGGLVVLSWFWVRPRPFRDRGSRRNPTRAG